MKREGSLKRFKNKVCANPLSTILQVAIIILLTAVLCTTFLDHSEDNQQNLYSGVRIAMFGVSVVLILVQWIRLKCPMLVIDRIFANSPGKQVVLAFFAFVFTVDLAMCMFPTEGIRSSLVNIIREPLAFPLLLLRYVIYPRSDSASSKVKSFGLDFSFAISFSF